MLGAAAGAACEQPDQANANERCRNGVFAHDAADRIDDARCIRSNRIERTAGQFLRIQVPVKRIDRFIQFSARAVDVRLDFLRRPRPG